jgi:hypothetical protein
VHPGIGLDTDEVVSLTSSEKGVLEYLLSHVPSDFTSSSRDVSDIDRVRPIGKVPGDERSASTASRWERTIASLTAR